MDEGRLPAFTGNGSIHVMDALVGFNSVAAFGSHFCESSVSLLSCCLVVPLMLPHFFHLRLHCWQWSTACSDVHFLQHGRIGEYVVRSPMVIGHESAGVVVQLGAALQQSSSSSSSNKLPVVGDAVALEPGVPCWHCQVSATQLRLRLSWSSLSSVSSCCAQHQGQVNFMCVLLPPLSKSQCSRSSTAGSISLVGAGVQAAREGRYNLDPNIQFFATPPVHGSLASFVDHPLELCYKLPPGLSLEQGAMCEPLSVGIHACRWGAGGLGAGLRHWAQRC